jgi:hypothetical protein
MELRIEELKLPAEVIHFNYEELKKELTEKVSKYDGLIYTESDIKDAKADRAQLNKFKKALNDERLRQEKEYMTPFNVFKNQINELIGIIDKPVSMIDKQVKDYEEKKKAEKRIEIGSIWETYDNRPEWLPLSRIFDERWLNAGYSIRQIREDIEGWLNRIDAEMISLGELPEFNFEAIQVYKHTLDMNQAIQEGQRMARIQKAKAEEEAVQSENQSVEEAAGAEMAEGFKEGIEKAQEGGQWISFSACLTVSQAKALKEFFDSNNIDFKAI